MRYTYWSIMSHVTRTDDSCRTYKWVMSHIWISRVTREWILIFLAPLFVTVCVSHVQVSHESCPVDEWVMAHTWVRMHAQPTRSHVTWHILVHRESCHTCEWVMSHIPMSHVAYMNESCHTYGWVISHMEMGHVMRMNESCHLSWCGPRACTADLQLPLWQRHTHPLASLRVCVCVCVYVCMCVSVCVCMWKGSFAI